MIATKEGGVVGESVKVSDLAEADYIAGMKYKDIAKKYNVSINTIKSWKKRHGWCRSNVNAAHKIENGCTHTVKGASELKDLTKRDIEEVATNEELTDKQQLFCVLYVKTFNVTKAYQRAFGAKYNTAATEGCKLLKNPNIKEQILKLKMNRFNRELLSEEDIFQRYIDIAFADIKDYVEWGNEEIEVPTDTGSVIMKKNVVRFRDSEEVDGTLISEIRSGRQEMIKLPDRMKALQWLSDHMDIMTEKQRSEIELLKSKLSLDQSEQIQDDGFLEALNGTAGEDWSDEEV